MTPAAGVRSLRHSSGEVGGVASKVGQISTFANSIAHAKITTDGLIIALPMDHGPFDEALVQQVIREVTDLRLVHETDLFLSLNFASDGSLISVAHPALKGRLLGDIALWIDFELKAILNGYALPKDFAKTWEATRNRDENYLRPHVMSLKDYCKKKPCKGKPYFSLRELMSEHGAEDTASNPDTTEQPYQISFRVIASQSKIQKHGNVLIPHPQYRVEYTIEKTAAFSERLEAHRRATGSYPTSYQKLEQACSEYAKEIEIKLPDMPFSGKFLYLLGIANAWSYVTETLKELGLVAQLTPRVYADAYPFPSVLPPLPVAYFSTIPLTINFQEVLQAISESTVSNDLNRELSSLFTSRARPTFSESATALLSPIMTTLCQKKMEQAAPQLRHERISDTAVKEFTWRATQVFPELAIGLRTQIDTFVKASLTDLEEAERATSPQPKQPPKPTKQPKPALKPGDAYRKLSPVDQLILLKQSLKDQKALQQLAYFEGVIHSFPKALLNFKLTTVSIATQYTHESVQFTPSKGQPATPQRVKLVGGCATDLHTMSTQPIPHGAALKRSIEKTVSRTSGHFSKLTFEGKTYQVFRVPVTHLDDFAPPRVYLQQPQLSTEDAQRNVNRLLKQLTTTPVDINALSSPASQLTQPLDQSGATLSHYAAIALSFKDFTAFYTANPSQLRVSDEAGHLPIHLAAQAGHADKVEWILQHHRDLRTAQTKQGLTPLWIAVQWGRRAVIKSLVDAKVPVFYQRSNELFPLYVAIQNGFSDIAKMLLDAMSVQEANTVRVDGMTALHEAIETHLWDVATALIYKGVSLHTARKNDGFTPFHSAVAYSQVALMQLMLQKGAEINTPAVFGNTPLHIAARTGDTASLTVLRQHRASESRQNSAGETPLMVAITSSQLETARMLIVGLSPNQVDTQGRGSCLLALQHGLPTIFDQLLTAHGEALLTRGEGLEVLYHLVSHGDYFRVHRFLQLPTLSYTSYQDRDFIDIAAQFGHFSLMHLFRSKRGPSSPPPSYTLLAHYFVQYDEVALLHDCLPLLPTMILPLTKIAAEKASIGCLKVLLPMLPKTPQQKSTESFPENLVLEGAKSGNPQVIRLLMQTLPTTHHWLNMPLNAQQETALHISARFGFVQSVKTCIELGADVQKRDHQGQTLYHIVRSQQNAVLLDVLLQETAPTDWPKDIADVERYPASDEIKAILKKYKQHLPLVKTAKKRTQEPSLPQECPAIPTKEESKQLTALLQNADFDEAAALCQEKPALLNLFQLPQGEQLWRLISQGLHEPHQIVALFTGIAHEALFSLFKAQHIEPHFVKEKGNVLHDILVNEDEAAALYRLNVLHTYFPDSLVFMLHEAVLAGNIAVMNKLLSYYPIDTLNTQQQTVLMLATLRGNTPLVQQLLRLGANPNLIDVEGNTLLHFAILSEHQDTALSILPLSTHKNRPNYKGHTPLMLASSKGMLPIVLAISEDGDYTQDADKQGWGALHFATQAGQITCIKALVAHGHSVHQKTGSRKKHQKMSLLLQDVTDFQQEERARQFTPLQLALVHHQIEAVATLRTLGADPHQTDAQGLSGCEYAVISKQIAIERMADTWPECHHNSHQAALLLAAAESDNVNAIYAWVLQHPLDVTQSLNDKRQQLLHMCALHNAHRLARYVLETYPVAIDAVDKAGYTPLAYASYLGHVAMVELFASFGAHLNLQHTAHRKSALHHACEEDHLGDHHGVIHVLLSYGADLTLLDADGRKPLQALSYPFSVKNIARRFATKQTWTVLPETTAALNSDQEASHTHATPPPIAQPHYIPPQCANVQPAMAQIFCVELMAIPSSQLTSSEKQRLLFVAQQCFKQPMQETDPAEWLVMTQYIRKTFGSHMLYRLFVNYLTPNDGPMTFQDYSALMQAMLDLHETPDLYTLIRNTPRHAARQLLARLQEEQTKLLERLYPERSIDEVLTTFQTQSDWVRYPITAEEAALCKTSYTAIRQDLKTLPQESLEALTRKAQQLAKDYQKNPDIKTQASLLAIIVEVMRRTTKLGLYDTQLISVLLFLQKPQALTGRALKMGSGQGKSAAIIALSGFLASIGRSVDIVTTASELGERDVLRFRPFFHALGLTASSISHVQQTQTHFNANILFGTITDYQFPFLRAGLWHQNMRGNRPFDVLIGDEFDAHFFDDAFHSARIAVVSEEDTSWVYGPILDIVKRKKTVSVKTLKHYLHSIVDESHHAQLLEFSDAKLERWINSAKTALWTLKEGRDYVVERATDAISSKQKTKDNILIMNFMTNGRPAEGSQWQDGIHQFLQVKHKLPITPETRTGASMSVRNYLSLYNTTLALSGTLGEAAEREEMKSIAHMDTRDIPYRFPSLLKHDSTSIVQHDTEQYEKALKKINTLRAKGRPVLVLIETIQDVERFNAFLVDRGLNQIQILTTQQKENENYIIARAGNSGQITLSTNAAGRGTDIPLAPESLAAGGLYVLKLFYPKNTRVQEQAENRAARLGQPGGTGMILSFKSSSVQNFIQHRFPWSAQHTPEILSVLEQTRAKHTEVASLQRQQYGQVESVVFQYLLTFFDQYRQVHLQLNSASFRTQLHLSDDKADRLISAASEAIQQHWSIFYDELQHLQPFTEETVRQFHAQHELQLAGYPQLIKQIPHHLARFTAHFDTPNKSGLIQTCMQLIQQPPAQTPPSVEKPSMVVAKTAFSHAFFNDGTANTMRVATTRPVCLPEEKAQAITNTSAPSSWTQSFCKWLTNINATHSANPAAKPTPSQALT